MSPAFSHQTPAVSPQSRGWAGAELLAAALWVSSSSWGLLALTVQAPTCLEAQDQGGCTGNSAGPLGWQPLLLKGKAGLAFVSLQGQTPRECLLGCSQAGAPGKASRESLGQVREDRGGGAPLCRRSAPRFPADAGRVLSVSGVGLVSGPQLLAVAGLGWEVL